MCLAKITGAHGIKGLVKIRPFCDDVGLLENTSPLFTSENGEDTLSLTLKNSQGKYMLAEIENVQDRNGSEALRGTELWAPRDLLPALGDNDGYYIEDLIGMQITDTVGKALGTLKDVHNYGASDLLDIDFKDGQNALIPFTDDFAPHVDLDKKQITIQDYEGFLS